ncbi:MAG: hypothetical protein MJZ24_09130 [Paludibacteraceae bacterium]|nr:hypothetical protein [Paludibacteraceae bacterium]
MENNNKTDECISPEVIEQAEIIWDGMKYSPSAFGSGELTKLSANTLKGIMACAEREIEQDEVQNQRYHQLMDSLKSAISEEHNGSGATEVRIEIVKALSMMAQQCADTEKERIRQSQHTRRVLFGVLGAVAATAIISKTIDEY